ncbi:HTH-type transcriptional regulator GltC [Sulfitobacter sp. THAF37]|nr:HTH-type transcriptional regulator GltC [Sulfitobacter sp. THAF37]
MTVADSGGVTRAAGFLHLTQSAVSMQLKRLEDMLGLELLDRTGRTIALTASGEQLLVYARRMVALNDEVIERLTDHAQEGEITLGVPHDIVYPAVPQVLKKFHAEFPRVRVHLEASHTRTLKDQFAKGDCDLILTTETDVDPGGETLVTKSLEWVGAPGGAAWRQRPLQLAFCRYCTFRPRVVGALDDAQIDWQMAVDTESDRAVEAAVSADLAIHAMIDGNQPPYLQQIDHGGALPILPRQQINLYGANQKRSEAQEQLAALLRAAFALGQAPRASSGA